MICEYCGKGDLLEGTLEGVSFKPSSEDKKWLAKGIYGIKAMACPECGRLSNFSIDTETLRKLMKK